ncbi:phosphatidylinositol N-acetylglucosaminyltransferase [Malassezia psittaci]|uniref:phosphatidylinositol N-acetylglucosaminyltransferase n=1 Tax=Malassezia psittaci TaxID=1821823 RepID=A0AAF0FET6_9BASI|nr:phosphatidylinositol N-acetylglucosaminyltransferase [Malassezia psittaci]
MEVARQAADVARAQVAGQQWKEALEGTLYLLQTPHTWDVQVGSTLSIGLDVLLHWAQNAKKTKALVDDRETWHKLQMQLARTLHECHASTANRIRRVISILLDVTKDYGDLDQEWVQEWFTRAESEPDSQMSLIILELLLSQRSAFVLSKLSMTDFFTSIIDAMQAGRGIVSRRSRLAMAFLNACQDQSQSIQPWLVQLAQALILAEDRGMENLMVHLVQPLLDARPDLLDSLIKHLAMLSSNYQSPVLAEQYIRSLLAVLRIAKARNLMVWEDEQIDASQTEAAVDTRVCVPRALLDKCVTSASYRLQVAALGLTVESKTPAESLHPTELAAWCKFFQSGLALPSAVARKDIIANFVKLLVRMRVSMHALKKKDANSHLLKEMQSTLQTLYKYALQSTHPQSPYASRILGVSMTFLLLESVLALSAPKSELNNFPLQDAVRALHKAKQTYPATMSVPGITPNTALTLRLLNLASKSTYSDIQQTAALLLLRLAPIQSTSLTSPEFLRERIVKPSIMQLGATKESDAYAALQLLRLYSVCAEFDQEYVLAELERLALSIHTSTTNKTRVPKNASWLIQLLAAHIDLLNARIAYATTHGIAKASQQQALHGTLSAVEFLLSRVSNDIPTDMLEAIEQCVNNVWDLAAPVLCAAAPEGNSLNMEDDQDDQESDDEPLTQSTYPSKGSLKHHNQQQNHKSDTHAQPASELQAAMQLTDIPDTPTYQRILSYAWRALRSTASLHATTLCLASSKQIHSMLESGSNLFIAWMLKIRHRGAFSTIFPELDRVAQVLLEQGLENPTHWLKRLLSQLDADCEQYSTTRRSAGIGYAVLALLRAHVRHGLRPLLSECCAQLVEMSHSLDSSIRTTHAMNILRVLVMDSTLAPFMREHLGTALARAVTCFCSPHWNVRNASMMLFSAISTRYYGGHAYADLETGPKYSKGSFSSLAINRTSTPTLDRLLVSSPALGMALVDVLKEDSQRLRAEDLETVGHGSSLFAALLLLSTIQDPTLHASILPLPQIQAQVEKCAYSANLKLRVQAAKCFPKLVGVSRYASSAERLWHEASLADQNKLHGQLLLLDAMDACIDLERIDLLEKNPCAVTAALYLDIAHKSLMDHPQIATKAKPIAEWVERLVQCVSGNTSRDSQHKLPIEPNAFDRLVHDPFVCWLLPVVFRFAIAFPNLVKLPHATSLLQDSDNVVAEALLQCFEDISKPCSEALTETLSSLNWDASHFQACLVDLALLDSASRNVRVSAAKLAHALRNCANCDWVSRRGPLLITAWSVDSISVRQALLPLLGLATRENPATSGDSLQPHQISYDAYLRGCLPLWKASAEERSTVSLRMSTIDAIGAAISTQGSEPRILYELRLLLLKLLHDDDADVRGTACRIASQHITQARKDHSLAKFGSGFELLRMGEMQCTELLYQVISAETPIEFSKHVQEYLLPGRCIADVVDCSSSQSDTALFSTEELNQYHDRVLDMLRAHRYFAQRKLPVPDSLANAILYKQSHPQTDQHGEFGEPNFQDQLRATLIEDLAARFNGTESRDAVVKAFEQLLIPEPKQDESHARYRIALISDFFFPNVGGVEGHMYMIGQHLLQRGHKVIVITHAYEPNRSGVRYLPSGMKVYYVPLKVIARQDTLPNFFGLLPILRWILIREQIQIVHAHQALSSMAHEAIFHAKGLGLRAVFTDHSLFDFADVGSILTNKLLGFALNDADHVVCVSHTGRENTVLRAKLQPKDVSTIPNAIDASQFYPTGNAPKDHICIVVLSRLMYRKGIDLLLSAIPELCHMHPDITFLIGGDGPKFVDLEQMREQFMLQDRVHLVGAIRQRDVNKHLNSGHIFLNTSLTEAFGTSIIEATCAGLCVVSTSVGGIPELLPTSMIRLAQPTTDAIVSQTSLAIEQIRHKQHDSWSQHRAVKQMYSWSDTVKRLERVYANVMQLPPRTSSDRFLRHWVRDGVIAGKILCIIIAVQMVMFLILDMLYPARKIPRARTLQAI